MMLLLWSTLDKSLLLLNLSLFLFTIAYKCIDFATAKNIVYIHTEIHTLKSRRVNFRSQTDVNQSNVAYRFSHM